MFQSYNNFKKRVFFRLFTAFLALTFATTPIVPMGSVYAQELFNLPAPGTMILPTPNFLPPLIKGITINPQNPLKFNFIIHNGDSKVTGKELEDESIKQIKYFLASLTVPETEMWVNLSPYEKDRIIPDSFGLTEMGRDLLMQDYILKQLTASLIYPEDELGKQFWERTYQKAYELYGATDIPVNTFNKIWIVPEKALVYERGNTVFVLESHLKVMLEGDYMALKQNLYNEELGTDKLADSQVEELSEASEEIVREVLLPEIEKEVNEGKNFVELRQIYNAMILAAWYKKKLHQSLLGKIYMDQNKVKGVDVDDPQVKQKIYNQYLEAFKKGVYNFIKDEYDSDSQEMVSRTYFSGGFDHTQLSANVLSSVESNSRAARAHYSMLGVSAEYGELSDVEVDVGESPDGAMASPSPGFILPRTVTSIFRGEGQASSLAVSEPKNEYYVDERISLVVSNVNYNGHLMVVLQGSGTGQSALRARELLASTPIEGQRGELGALFKNAVEDSRGNIPEAITKTLGWLRTRLAAEGLQEPLGISIVYEEMGLRLAVTKSYVASLSARMPVIIANQKGQTIFNAREAYEGDPTLEGDLMADNYTDNLQISEVQMGPGHVTILGSESLTSPGAKESFSVGEIERNMTVLVRIGGKKAKDLVDFAVEKRGVDTSERGVIAIVQRQVGDAAMPAAISQIEALQTEEDLLTHLRFLSEFPAELGGHIGALEEVVNAPETTFTNERIIKVLTYLMDYEYGTIASLEDLEELLDFAALFTQVVRRNITLADGEENEEKETLLKIADLLSVATAPWFRSQLISRMQGDSAKPVRTKVVESLRTERRVVESNVELLGSILRSRRYYLFAQLDFDRDDRGSFLAYYDPSTSWISKTESSDLSTRIKPGMVFFRVTADNKLKIINPSRSELPDLLVESIDKFNARDAAMTVQIGEHSSTPIVFDSQALLDALFLLEENVTNLTGLTSWRRNKRIYYSSNDFDMEGSVVAVAEFITEGWFTIFINDRDQLTDFVNAVPDNFYYSVVDTFIEETSDFGFEYRVAIDIRHKPNDALWQSSQGLVQYLDYLRSDPRRLEAALESLRESPEELTVETARAMMYLVDYNEVLNTTYDTAYIIERIEGLREGISNYANNADVEEGDRDALLELRDLLPPVPQDFFETALIRLLRENYTISPEGDAAMTIDRQGGLPPSQWYRDSRNWTRLSWVSAAALGALGLAALLSDDRGNHAALESTMPDSGSFVQFPEGESNIIGLTPFARAAQDGIIQGLNTGPILVLKKHPRTWDDIMEELRSQQELLEGVDLPPEATRYIIEGGDIENPWIFFPGGLSLADMDRPGKALRPMLFETEEFEDVPRGLGGITLSRTITILRQLDGTEGSLRRDIIDRDMEDFEKEAAEEALDAYLEENDYPEGTEFHMSSKPNGEWDIFPTAIPVKIDTLRVERFQGGAVTFLTIEVFDIFQGDTTAVFSALDEGVKDERLTPEERTDAEQALRSFLEGKEFEGDTVFEIVETEDGSWKADFASSEGDAAMAKQVDATAIREFEDFLRNVEGRRTGITIDITGDEAARRYGYSSGFGVLYDELIKQINRSYKGRMGISPGGAIRIIRNILVDQGIERYRSTKTGAEEFEEFLRMITQRRATVTVGARGAETRRTYGFGTGFADFYDEFMDRLVAERQVSEARMMEIAGQVLIEYRDRQRDLAEQRRTIRERAYDLERRELSGWESEFEDALNFDIGESDGPGLVRLNYTGRPETELRDFARAEDVLRRVQLFVDTYDDEFDVSDIAGGLEAARTRYEQNRLTQTAYEQMLEFIGRLRFGRASIVVGVSAERVRQAYQYDQKFTAFYRELYSSLEREGAMRRERLFEIAEEVLRRSMSGAAAEPAARDGSDYYGVLGVARNADSEEIKKAYRQLSLKYHPDRNPGDTAAEQNFKDAQEAYAVLSDAVYRGIYDRDGRDAIQIHIFREIQRNKSREEAARRAGTDGAMTALPSLTEAFNSITVMDQVEQIITRGLRADLEALKKRLEQKQGIVREDDSANKMAQRAQRDERFDFAEMERLREEAADISAEARQIEDFLNRVETKLGEPDDVEGDLTALLREADEIEAAAREGDSAMTPKYGGIDLAPGFLNLQIKRNDNGIPLPIEWQDLPSIKIDGLYPVIINITPVTNLPLLLGELETEETIASSI